MPIVLQDGTPLSLQDGSQLLAQGESGATSLPVASATASAAALTPAAVLPAAAGAPASAAALTPAAVLPAAGAAASAFAPSAFLPLPAASAGTSAVAPLVPPVTPAAAGASASAAAPRPAVIIPPASAAASAGLPDEELPVASAAVSAGRVYPAALLPPASMTAQAAAPHVPLPVASATAGAHALIPPGRLPAAASAAARARPLVPPAGSTLNPGYPDGDLDAMVELWMGGGWVDATAAALPDGRQAGQVKGGQPDGSQQPIPAGLPLSLDNPGPAFTYSPRNSAGPYYGELRQNTPARVSFASPYGTYLRLEADDDDLASVADTSALHVTGSLELRIGVRLSDHRACTLAARNDGTTPSWSLILNPDGTLSFYWYDSGGTLHHVDSPAAPSVSWMAFRVTLDATNGNVQFYVSSDIDGTWTSLGAAASGTSGAATSVRAGNSPLVVGWSNAGGTQMRGQVYGLRLYSGIGGTKVADAAFNLQVPGVTTWTDYAGLTWVLSGGAEITRRDYRGHLEVASAVPSADPSNALWRTSMQLAGRLRRLQQGAAPAVYSPMKRAVLSRAAAIGLVDYWTMEELPKAKVFGPAAGTQPLTATLGTVQASADSSFEASAPLPTLGGDSLTFTVDTYSGGSGWAVRFLWKRGSTLPATGSVRLLELNTTGACTKLQVVVDSDGNLNFKGFLSGGSAAWTEAAEQVFPQNGSPGWWSVEATPSGSNVTYALIALAPGASVGNTDAHTVTGHGSYGVVSSGTVNPDLALNDTVFGHLSVQKTVDSLFGLGAPLNAWRGELTDVRFARVCAEQGIPCRILGRSVVTQQMGPQPSGPAWAILKDCVQAEQGLAFEPRDVFGLGFRTREALGVQQPGLTLDFSLSNLIGDVQPVGDDSGFLNDVTGSMPDGTSWRAVLDDGSAKSVSEPRDGGSGAYAGNVPFPLNVADASMLPAAVALYLKRASVDEARVRNIAADFGIPGAPVADIARLRPGDLVQLVNVPAGYQTADVKQLATGFTEPFGPGRKLVLDGVPWSPYS